VTVTCRFISFSSYFTFIFIVSSWGMLKEGGNS